MIKMTSFDFSNKAVYFFNKFYSSFLKDLKASNEEIRTIIKQHYKAIDKRSIAYVNEWCNQGIIEDVGALCTRDTDVLEQKEVCKNVTFSMVSSLLNEEDTVIFWNYVYILSTFAWIIKQEDEDTDVHEGEGDGEDAGKDDILFNSVLKVLGMIQSRSQEQEENADAVTDSAISKELDDILEDDIRSLLICVKETSTTKTSTASKETPFEKFNVEDMNADAEADADADAEQSGAGFDKMFEKMEGSKLADIAKEISKDIDVEALKDKEPEEIINSLFDFSGSNNMLGDIVSKISSTIGTKMNSGEINQDDIMKEAFSMMSMFGGSDMSKNPIVGQMLQGMMGGMGGGNPLGGLGAFANMFGMGGGSQRSSRRSGTRTGMRTSALRTASTRDRLRHKLEQRNATNTPSSE